MVTGPSKALGASGPVRTDQSAFYLREIRNWMRFIGIVVIVNVIAAIIIGVVIGVQLSHAVSNSVGSTAPATNCLSLGGTDPSC
jgi:hypothetical protein